jgi:predicted phage terminase large subunit-like protein
MEFEPEHACRTKWGGDRRTIEGELLVPDRFDAAAVAEIKRDLGSQAAAAQLQQRPTPGTGNIFKRDWFAERWLTLPEGLFTVISADCTFKDSASADFVAIHVWGIAGGKFYLLDRICDRMGLPETIRCMLTLAARWPHATAKLIEDKANGPAVEQMLRDKMPGIIMMEPARMGGSKVGRANSVSPLAEAGDVILPAANAQLAVGKNGTSTVLTYEWIDDMVESVCAFPFARHDDDVDAMTQALIFLHNGLQSRYLEAMRRLAKNPIHFGSR